MNYIELSNGSKKILVRFRRFQPNDSDKLIRCIQDEYGESYFKRNFYNADYLKSEYSNGHIIFLVAERDNGDIVGMLALKRFLPRESMCEIASEIFLKEYRGFKMAYPFFKYALRQIHLMKNVSAIYCLPVVFHDISQKLMERIRLTPCGFVFGAFLMSKIRHSYKFDENLKHPQGIMIHRLGKKDAGVLYLPQEHQDIASEIYNQLNVKFKFGESKTVAKKTIYTYDNDEVQENCAIYIDIAGNDILEIVEEIQDSFQAQNQTFNIFLNISESGAIAAYESLKQIGYFFAGFQPLCSEREIMVLHNPRKVPINMQTLTLTPRFRYICDYIEKFYKERCKNP